MTSVILDTTAVTDFAQNRVLRRTIERLLDAQADVHIPSAVLAEALSGSPQYDVTTHQTLRKIDAADVDVACGKLAGRLRGSVSRSASAAHPSGVDALVVAFANNSDPDSIVFTSDVRDLKALASWAPERVRIEPIPT